MSKIKLVSLLLACFAIIAASPLAMGVTIYGGTGVSTSGGGQADGSSSATYIQNAAAGPVPAILDAYLYAHARVPNGVAGAATAYAHYTGSVSSTLDPNDVAATPANLGSFTAAASGDVNAGVSVTANPAAPGVDALAVIGARVMKTVTAGGLRDNSPVQGSAYVFSKIDGTTVNQMPLGGSGAGAALPTLGAAGVFNPTAISGVASGEAYAKAVGAAAFTGTGKGLVSTQSSQIYGNVNANTYVETTLDSAAADAVSAVVATASAQPGSLGTGRLSNAQAGVLTRLDLSQAVDGRSNAIATATKGTGADVAAKAGGWDYTTTGSRLPNSNENVFASADGSLESTANTRRAGDVVGTGARVITIADHDTSAVPLYGSEEYAATFIQTYGAGRRVLAGLASTQVVAYGSKLEDASSSSVAREGTKSASQSATVGSLNPTFDDGFSAGGHMLGTTSDTTGAAFVTQYASSLYTQEAFGKVMAGVGTYSSTDTVVVNRQAATIPAPMPAASVNDPYGFWGGVGTTAATMPTVAGGPTWIGGLTQGITTNGPRWTGVSTNDVGANYGLTGSATANAYADNVKIDTDMSDINWIEGSSLIYTISNLQKSFTFAPAGSVQSDLTITQAANPNVVLALYTPYRKVVEAYNTVP